MAAATSANYKGGNSELMNKSNQQTTIETAGAILADGTALELARNACGQLALLHCVESSATIVPHFEFEQRTYIPLSLHPSLADVVILPSQLRPYGSTQELLTEVEQFLSTGPELSDGGAALLARFSLATHLPECLLAAPVIAMHGDFENVAEVLRFLRCVCRHPLVLGTLQGNTMVSLPLQTLMPTLLIAQSTYTPKVREMLNASSRKHLPIVHRGQLVDTFCCKAIHVGDTQDVIEGALQVTVVSSPSRRPTEKELEQVAEVMQSKLLGYRMAYCCHTAAPLVPCDRTIAGTPLSNSATALLAAVADDRNLVKSTIDLVRPQIEHIRAETSMTTAAFLIECLLGVCHEGKSEIQVKELRELTNTLLQARGETVQLTDPKVGYILNGNGLYTQRLTGSGNVRGLLLLSDVRRRIHQVAARLGVATIREHCSLCQETWRSGLANPVPQSATAETGEIGESGDTGDSTNKIAVSLSC